MSETMAYHLVGIILLELEKTMSRSVPMREGPFIVVKVTHLECSHAGETRWDSSQQLIELATSLYNSIITYVMLYEYEPF